MMWRTAVARRTTLPAARMRRLVGLTCLAGAAACGNSNPADVVAPDPLVEPFVGDWEAEEFRVTSAADAQTTFDLVAAGGSFTINVQPSGQYTAILELPDLPTPEIELGQLSVIGESVRLDPQDGPPATSSFEFDGSNRLTLEGPTEFDFNQDGTADEATARIVLERQSG